MISKSQVKYIQSLGQKKYRDKEGLFIAEGPKLIKELLQNKNVGLKWLFALNKWIEENEKLLRGIDVFAINESELERISQLKTPNQVIAVIKKFDTKEPEVEEKISLALDTIQDPGNLGTIIRIADWFGVAQIICSHDCADVYNPKVIQATMGSIARVNVFYTDLFKWLKQQNQIKIYATALEGKDVTKMGPMKEGLIIIGNESKGIHEELIQLAHERITIPKKARLNDPVGQGTAESLNAAVAAGIVLSNLV
jgi:RNA methyltransferase, TrmH family